jgi:hypothetical protein
MSNLLRTRMEPIQIWPDPVKSKPVSSPVGDNSAEEKTILAYKKIIEQLRLEELQKETELPVETLKHEKKLHQEKLQTKTKVVVQEKSRPDAKRGVRKIYKFVIIFAILSAIFSNSYFVFANLSQDSQPKNFASTLPDNFFKPVFNINTFNDPPVRLMIPTINVDASVQQIGQTPDGAIDVPDKTTDVGWYKFGPVPGQKGTAIIDAHFDNSNGFSAVFGQLRNLREEDKIIVKDSRGKSISFTVKNVRSFPVDQKVSEILSGDDGDAHLALITCNGIWDINKATYTERLVVFADIVKN